MTPLEPESALPAARARDRVHPRDELLSDLGSAVAPTAAPTALVLFGFPELAKQLESLLELEADELLAEVTARILRAAGAYGVLYELRRGEFCALFAGRLKDAQPLLNRAVRNLDKHTKKLGLTTITGVVELPIEAASPAAALELVNKRRGNGARARRVAARTSVATRVSNAVGKLEAPSEPGADPAASESGGSRSWL